MNTVTEQVFDYEVSFLGDDTKVVFTVTDTKDNLIDDEVVEKAEKELCALWGVDSMPLSYYVTEVEMYGRSL